MAALISKGPQAKRRDVVVVLGDGLKDAREEMFIIMVCDGLPLRLAFKRAGFESKDNAASSKLFALPRIQERAQAILEARRTTGVLSLAEVTDMLKRVYAGAQSAEEYSAAHNAAFSLARLYGHVTDRATLEVIRRPSRDPDAPSEQALTTWVETLPGLPSPADTASSQTSQRAASPAPAALLGPEPSATPPPIMHAEVEHVIEPSIDWHGPADGRGEIGNGAPTAPVTGAPTERGHSAPLEKTGSPFSDQGTVWPSVEELFG